MNDTQKKPFVQMTTEELIADGWTVFSRRDVILPEVGRRQGVTLKKDGMTQVRLVP